MSTMEIDREQFILRAALKMGIDVLKEKQKEAIGAFLEGNDVFLTVPTGYGKSLVYGIIPFAFDIMRGTSGSIVICVSPLTSIMLDQADKFKSRGLSVGYIGEGQHDPSISQHVLNGECQLVLISPENIINDTPYRNMLLSDVYQKKTVCLAVDEAHCVQTWGSTFRTAFARLGELRGLLANNVNVMALTATATTDTLEAVKVRLTMPNPIVIGLPPHRRNIFYCVKPYLDIFKLSDFLMKYIEQHIQDVPKAVIFCPTLDGGSQLNKLLNVRLTKRYGETQLGLVDMYNKACSISKREAILECFCKELEGKLRIIIASTSFGMGVDCPNIRTVIHWGPPTDIDMYMQETGRAGRDGANSCAYLLYGHASRFVSESMKQYGLNSSLCRRKMLYEKFLFSDIEFEMETKCVCCDLCSCICECDNCIAI